MVLELVQATTTYNIYNYNNYYYYYYCDSAVTGR